MSADVHVLARCCIPGCGRRAQAMGPGMPVYYFNVPGLGLITAPVCDDCAEKLGLKEREEEAELNDD